MSKNTVKVCVRTRPTQNFAQDNLFVDVEHGSIVVKHHDPAGESGILNNRQNTFKFSFDHVFHNAAQAAVYDLYARDTVHDVVYGINGAVLTYGQTGSGKTFTMIGDAASYEHRGIAPRAITQLFQEINSRVELEFLVSCTYMEIYNERIYDLLVDVSNPDVGGEYTIVEEKDGRGIFVRGLTEIEVRDEASALNLLFTGGLSRTMATHKLNKRSNRSHSIFTLYLQQRQRSGVSERIVHSKLHLVDLAGSERLKKTMDSADGTMGDEVSRKESMAINRSLTYLEQCVVALTRKGQSHIPFRQSKLTNILKDCLGANCNTVMIACIWGEASHLEETVSTLRLASRMNRVVNESTSVESVDPTILLKKQEKLIKALKQELLMHDALVERTGMVYDNYTPEQQQSISQMIEKYVNAPEKEEEEVLEIDTFRKMLEICKQFKKKLLEARSQSLGVAGRLGQTGEFFADSKDGGLTMDGGMEMKGLMTGAAKEVGAPSGNNRGGFALGEAKLDSRPLNGIETAANFIAPPKSPTNASMRGGAGGFGSPPRRGGDATNMIGNSGVKSLTRSPDRLDALLSGGDSAQSLEMFVKNDEEGAHLFSQYTQAKKNVKELRTKVRNLTMDVNSAKIDIDRCNQDVDQRKQVRIAHAKQAKGSAGDDIVDGEEMRLVKELKDAKQRYRNNFEQLSNKQKELQAMQQDLDQYKAQLVDCWQQWLQNANGSLKKSLDFSSDTYFDDMQQGNQNIDEMDDQEAFDKLEAERVMSNDPDSLAFFTAQKTRRANLTQSGSNIKMLQKNKRFT